ncbi:MAG: DUF4920 domain-containing protein [Thermoanaerobaculia bacterium]
MKPLVTVCAILAILAGAAGCATRKAAPRAVYGSAPAISSAPLPLDRALSGENVGRTLAVRGRVAEVCKMKGCWMVLTDDRETVRITFKDYAFFVPRDLAGQTVVAEGVLSRKALTEEEAEHLAGESSAPNPPARVPREEGALLARSVVVP